MLQNAYFLANIGADTAENEHHFAEILPKTGRVQPQYPTVQKIMRLEEKIRDVEAGCTLGKSPPASPFSSNPPL